MSPPSPDKHDKHELLLGIKYESARLGGVSEEALTKIADQARDEIGANWDSDAGFVAGRDAVRDEHGLERLGGQSPAPAPKKKPWHRRLFGG